MNINEAKAQVRNAVEMYLAKDEEGFHVIPPSRQRPVFLLGAPGIGKTAIMEQIAHEMGIGLVSYSMTHHTRQSALGLPLIVHHEYEGYEYDASEYTMSEIIASLYAYMERTGITRGILFLDEINCVSETLYPSMLQFLQFKTFGRHSIPKDWVVVCAGNPPEYNKSVHEFDIVTLDRLRRMDVDPDYASWRAYALDSGIHPAIVAFLDVKSDLFYLVESSLSGKRFVTARGWSDLSDTVMLSERLGKPVDLSLVLQFLQDDETAEAFLQYYELFQKYRSDYQIDAILAGREPEDIGKRACAAGFDERLALLGLLLDAVVGRMEEALLEERVLLTLRDDLRAVKDKVLHGGLASAAFEEMVARLKRELEIKSMAGVADPREARVLGIALKRAKGLAGRCAKEGAHDAGHDGAHAFEAVSAAFGEQVSDFEESNRRIEAMIAHALDFIGRVFGEEREMLVFVSELASRSSSARYLNHIGSSAYHLHSGRLAPGGREQDLLARIDDLALGD